MLVRPTTFEDWEQELELRLHALADSPDSFRRTLEETRGQAGEIEEMASRSAQNSDSQGWIAELDGAGAGQAFSRLSEDGSTVHIYAMWVAPEARGKGVGRALLDAAEAWGRDRGVSRGRLAVTAGNSPAEGLYQGAGYEPTGDRELLREGSDLECVWMEKPL